MSQTFNLGGLGDNKLTKLIFSNGTANTCSIFLDNDGYLVFEQGANTVTFPLGELPVDKRLAIENGIVIEGRDVVNTGSGDNQNNLLVSDTTEDALVSAVQAALTASFPNGMNSLRFDGSSYLSKTALGSGPSQSDVTFSFWIKPSSIISTGDREYYFTHYSGDAEDWFLIDNKDGIIRVINKTTSENINYTYPSIVIRDLSAWYHFVFNLKFGGTPAVNFYVNGNSINATVSTAWSSGNHNVFNTTLNGMRIGGSTYFLNGYLANIHFIDGQALDANAFGEEISGVWVPKAYDPATSGAYGTNGFHLDFSDPSDPGKDVSGKNNHWTNP